MESGETAKRNGRRVKSSAQEASAAGTTGHTVELEKLVATQAESKAEPKAESKAEVTALAKQEKKASNDSALQVAPMGSIWNRPVAPSQIEVVESITVAGVRPIAASHLDIYGTILNGRPIMASHIHVSELTVPGQRPIFASDLEIRDDLSLPGGRPVFASDAALMHATLLPGGRPIASNEIDDSETLMGFLD